MTTGHVLLGLLRRGKQHGYDLKRRHDESFPASRPLAFGQIYAALGRLETKGWITQAGTERSGGPDRTIYEITDDGLAEVRRWAGEAEGLAGGVMGNPLGTKLTVAVMTDGPEAGRAYLRQQRAAHLERMREATAAKRQATGDIEKVLDADYTIGHLDADVQWMEGALEHLDEMGHRES